MRELQEEVVGRSNLDSNAWPDCIAAFKRICTKAMQYVAYHPRSKEFPMESCRPGEEFSDMFDRMCVICREKELEARGRVRRQFWSQLPLVFGTGPQWDLGQKLPIEMESEEKYSM